MAMFRQPMPQTAIQTGPDIGGVDYIRTARKIFEALFGGGDTGGGGGNGGVPPGWDWSGGGHPPTDWSPPQYPGGLFGRLERKYGGRGLRGALDLELNARQGRFSFGPDGSMLYAGTPNERQFAFTSPEEQHLAEAYQNYWAGRRSALGDLRGPARQRAKKDYGSFKRYFRNQ